MCDCQRLSNLTSNYSVLTLKPEIVDPDFIKLKIDSQVKFDNESTLLSSAELLSMVRNSISEYNLKFLQDFNSYFRYSQFLATIDQTDESITNNITNIRMINEKDVLLNNSANYTFNFSNGILPNSVSSLGFIIDGLSGTYYVDDDGLGNIRFYTRNVASAKVYTNSSSGTINYTTGEIIIPSLNITSIVGNDVSTLYNSTNATVTSGTTQSSVTRVYADAPASGSFNSSGNSSGGSGGGY